MDEHSAGIEGIGAGSPVVVYLHSPREKLWGLLQSLTPAGVFLHGIDLTTFDDWTRMIVRGERNIGLTHVFVPMWRVERVARDEPVDDIPSMAERFREQVGLTIEEHLSGLRS